MVKLISNPICSCSCCLRARLVPPPPLTGSLHSTIAEPDRSQGQSLERNRQGVQGGGTFSEENDVRPDPSFALSPVASTSKSPYIPPAATRLPNELLELILCHARPPLPATSTNRDPLSLAWTAFLRLSLVHSRWFATARQELARVVIIRTRRQMRALTDAFRDGYVGGKVEEILLEMKETSSGAERDKEASIVDDLSALVLALGMDAVPESKRDLLDLLGECGNQLKALRLRGFGDATLVSLSPELRALLPSLELFEYSPVDGVHSPSTESLFSLHTLPKLRHLILAPSSRYLTPLREPSETVIPGVTRLLDELPSLLAEPKMRDVFAEAFAECGMHYLESLSLHSLALTPLTLLSLLFPSLTSLTSLTLSSTFFIGASSTLFNLLSVVAPQLETFRWEDRLINPVPATAPPMLRRLGSSSLPAEPYWGLLRQLKKVKILKLFSPHIFESSPSRAGFVLPPDLEELSIGSRGEIEHAELKWWIDRVEEALDEKESIEEDEYEYEEQEGDEDEEEEEDEDTDEEEESPHIRSDDETQDDSDSEGKKLAASTKEDPEAGATGIADHASDSTPFRLARTPSSESDKVLASLPTRPSPPSTPPRPTRNLPLPSSSPSKSRFHSSSPRKRRLSWRHPPLPPSGGPRPQLRKLSLCTTDTTLRDDSLLQDRIEEVVERGVAVEWWSLQIVVLETLELTRELRVDMSTVAA
ncbi:hypothetical protein JCM11641_000758 [Rhodosporidiobolus odoratus]